MMCVAQLEHLITYNFRNEIIIIESICRFNCLLHLNKSHI
jgi:hypothetical protein